MRMRQSVSCVSCVCRVCRVVVVLEEKLCEDASAAPHVGGLPVLLRQILLQVGRRQDDLRRAIAQVRRGRQDACTPPPESESGRGPHNQLLSGYGSAELAHGVLCGVCVYEPKGLLHRLRALPSEVSQMRPLLKQDKC
jgi:hypothetical protein